MFLKDSYTLLEAVEKTNEKVNAVISAFKKSLNTCKLSKFNSQDSCNEFYSAFFMNNLNLEEGLTSEEWFRVYNTLLCDNTFRTGLIPFIALYKPAEFKGMFNGIRALIPVELETVKDKIRYLSNIQANLYEFRRQFEAIGIETKTQVSDTDTAKFLTVIDGSIGSIYNYARVLLRREVERKADMTAINTSVVNSYEMMKETVGVLESFDDEYLKEYRETMNEMVINKAKDAANDKIQKSLRYQKDFDHKVAKVWRYLQTKRRERKHAEMVGETLRLSHEIRRLIGSGLTGIINPCLPIITWIVTFAIDRATDKRDRDILIADLKGELEIMDEKIAIADRKGDDKEKIELMRIRQKMLREYQRISHIRYRPRVDRM